MKKTFITTIAVLMAAILLFSLCGCTRNDFFKQSILDRCLVPDLPHIEYKKAQKKSNRVYNFVVSEEAYENYVVSVYEYLSSLDFKYLGTRGIAEDGGLFMSPTTYEFVQCTELSQFKTSKGYFFVWANSITEQNHLIQRHYLEITYDVTLEYPVTLDLTTDIGSTYIVIEQ